MLLPPAASDWVASAALRGETRGQNSQAHADLGDGLTEAVDGAALVGLRSRARATEPKAHALSVLIARRRSVDEASGFVQLVYGRLLRVWSSACSRALEMVPPRLKALRSSISPTPIVAFTH